METLREAVSVLDGAIAGASAQEGGVVDRYDYLTPFRFSEMKRSMVMVESDLLCRELLCRQFLT